MISIPAVYANYTGTGPFGYTGKNASGAGATDGTEWIAATVDNFMWGPLQALFEHEGFSPNGVTEAAGGSSQVLDAWQNILPPGCSIQWNINTDPATYGARFLLLNGQGILRANYPLLDANVYVGDANNAAVAAGGGAFYHADDSAGTTPNTTGVYLILPETRGYVPRGLDLAASVDPDGASRYLGDNQLDAFQLWQLGANQDSTGVREYWGTAASRDARASATGATNETYTFFTTTSQGNVKKLIPKDDGINGTPRTSSETRAVNYSTQFAIRF